MKKALLHLVISLATTASAGFLSAPYTVLEPDYSKSNQLFLDGALRSIALGELVKNRVPAGSAVALVCLDGSDEPDAQFDKPLAAMLKDRLLTSLLAQGMIVLARDESSLHQIVRERAGQHLSLTPGQWKEAIRPIPSFDSNSNGPRVHLDLVPTHLRGADYLVSYRVEEFGLTIRDIPDSSDLEQREARVRLFVRIEDAKTGQILYADNLEASRKDRIPSLLEKRLADYHYAPALHEYPLSKDPRRAKSRVDAAYDYPRPAQIAYFTLKRGTTAGALANGDKIGSWDDATLFGLGTDNFSSNRPHLGDFYTEMNILFAKQDLKKTYTERFDVHLDSIRAAYAFSVKANYGKVWYPWPNMHLMQLSMGALLEGEFALSSFKMDYNGIDTSSTQMGYGIYPVGQVAAELRWRGNFVFRAGLDYAEDVGIGNADPGGLGWFFKFGMTR